MDLNGTVYPCGRILSNEASNKPKVPPSTHSMGQAGRTGWFWWVGGEWGQEDSSLAESIPHAGVVFCGDNLGLWASGQKGAGRVYPYFFQWAEATWFREVKHRQAANSSLLTWLPLVSKNFCWNWIYIFSVVLWVFLSFYFHRHFTWGGNGSCC